MRARRSEMTPPERSGSGSRRWWKRLWLRYLYYCKEHWIVAASLTLTALWILAQVAIQLLPAIIESGIIGLMGL